jgi:hypothetical protein
MPRHEKTTALGTGPASSTTTTPTTVDLTTITPAEEAWWQKALFCLSLVAVVGLLAGFEYQAGYHAGFGAWVSVGVPLAFDAYALWTWLDPDRNVWDELAAVAILAASVALSIAQPPPKWQALGIGMIAIVVEWRIVARRRTAIGTNRSLAATRAALVEARRQSAVEVEDLQRRLADADREVSAAAAELAAATAARVAAERAAVAGNSGGTSGGSAAQSPPWGRTKETQIEWLRRELAAGRNYTGEQVADRMGLGSAKTGRDRLAEARRLRIAKEA